MLIPNLKTVSKNLIPFVRKVALNFIAHSAQKAKKRKKQKLHVFNMFLGYSDYAEFESENRFQKALFVRLQYDLDICDLDQ